MTDATRGPGRSAPRGAAAPGLVARLGHNVTDTVVMAQRNLLRYVRLPRLLMFSSIQPIMFVVLFAYVFGGAIRTPGVNYIDYLIPGILIQTVLFGATQTTTGLADDLSKGIVDRFRSLPMARSAVLAGRTLADGLLRNLFTVGLMLAVGAIIGFRFQGSVWQALASIGVVAFFGYAFSWISALIGLLTRDPETAQVAGFIWVFPLVFASSAFVPVQTMPHWLRAFAKVQPISVTVNGVRYLTSGGAAPGVAPADVWQALLWGAAILLVFVPLAVLQYRRAV